MKQTENVLSNGLESKAIAELGHSFEEMSNKVTETTAELSEKGLSVIKQYPLHTALVAGGIGLILGALIARK